MGKKEQTTACNHLLNESTSILNNEKKTKNTSKSCNQCHDMVNASSTQVTQPSIDPIVTTQCIKGIGSLMIAYWRRTESNDDASRPVT